MNIQRFTATGFNPNNRCAEVAADDHGAWVLHDDVADMQRDAERYRWLRKNGKPAAEGLVMRNPDLWDEAIDTAMNGANKQ